MISLAEQDRRNHVRRGSIVRFLLASAEGPDTPSENIIVRDQILSARKRPAQAWGTPPQFNRSSDIDAKWNLLVSKPWRHRTHRSKVKASAPGPWRSSPKLCGKLDGETSWHSQAVFEDAET